MLKHRIIIPERIQLELVFGCNANCIMCPVNAPTKREKGIMSMELFRKIVDEMAPFKKHIRKFDLWGLGESLLDKALCEKIQYAKSLGFSNLAIATNADLLDAECQDDLLESDIDTVIFSIDGSIKETHEKIRRGTNFERVIGNVTSIIKKRNAGNYKTRFVLRFIRQESNFLEWKEFKKYWLKNIAQQKKDIIIGYDAHTWGGEISFSREEIKGSNNIDIVQKPCHHIFDRLMVFWDGTVPLCCSDLHHGKYSLGNVNDSSLIGVFNNEKINRIRKIHLSGKKNSIKICKECTILYSEVAQEVI